MTKVTSWQEELGGGAPTPPTDLESALPCVLDNGVKGF